MYDVSHQLYLEISDRLVGASSGREFFSGSVECCMGDVDCKLQCTLMVSYDEHDYPDIRSRKISNIVPVWWEFHTVVGSEELINDFSFREMCEIALH